MLARDGGQGPGRQSAILWRDLCTANCENSPRLPHCGPSAQWPHQVLQLLPDNRNSQENMSSPNNFKPDHRKSTLSSCNFNFCPSKTACNIEKNCTNCHGIKCIFSNCIRLNNLLLPFASKIFTCALALAGAGRAVLGLPAQTSFCEKSAAAARSWLQLPQPRLSPGEPGPETGEAGEEQIARSEECSKKYSDRVWTGTGLAAGCATELQTSYSRGILEYRTSLLKDCFCSTFFLERICMTMTSPLIQSF